MLTASTALDLAHELDDVPSVRLNQIRLATAAFYVGHHTEAESILRSTITEVERADTSERLDFAHQHLGKCQAEARLATSRSQV